MKPIPHTPNLFRLTRFAAVNCFLVREDDGLTLVDAGLPGSAAAFWPPPPRSEPRSAASYSPTPIPITSALSTPSVNGCPAWKC